ncbi:MAG TPA: hypothetical protein VJ828_12645, partial [Lacipirellulaceae bacterium]|nr:hypothetical protein [Lacipirellulaceae bacterium]
MSVVRWTLGLAILAYCAAGAMAQSAIQTAFNYNLQDEPAAPPAAPMAPERDGAQAEGAVVEGDHVGGAPCGCENGYGDCGCNNCDSGWGSCLGDCCLGDAWTLKSCLTPCCDTN